ncbi:MotA/TolQ/ExbB proton channel family protein [uncultured Ferrimonas sp.]|uniref:MotA/TolQ/ExbB proton channel family protein n=1 Tax=uncultured Ferrimonas sp. TaxID=432640 RepID=UPI002621BA0E|nr:MotA/TolQ/ExbB proton channel family protein [uncultured Ferrimonas sp.]
MNEGLPISELNQATQELVVQSCATHTSKRGERVSFERGHVLLLRPAEGIVPPFATAAFKSVPAILTTIGILGTFVGITLGLGALGNDNTGSAELVNQAMGLIEGLGTAFATSIAGMAASFIFMVSLSISFSVQSKSRQKLITEIQKKSKLISGNDLLHQIVEHQKESKSETMDFSSLISAIQGLIDKPSAMTSEEYSAIAQINAVQIDSSIDKLRKELIASLAPLKLDEGVLAQQLGLQVGTVLERNVAKPITDGLSDISHKVSCIDDLVAKTVTRSEIDDSLQRHVSVPITARLHEVVDESRQANQAMYAVSQALEALQQSNANPLTQEQLVVALITQVKQPLVEAIRSVKEDTSQIDSGVDQLTMSSAQVVASLNELSKSRMDEFDYLVKLLGDEVVKPVTVELHDTNRAVTKFASVSDDLNKNVVSSIGKLEETTEKVVEFEQRTLVKLDAFTVSMDRSLNEFATNSTKALSAISEEVKGIVQFGSRSIEQQTQAFSVMIGASESMFQEQAITLKAVGVESAQLMNSARHELESGLGDIDSKVVSMSSTVQRELERFRELYQQKLTFYFTEQNRLLDESLNDQKNGLNEVVDNFRGVFEDEYMKRSSLLSDLDQQFVQLAQAAERVQSMAKAMGLEKADWVSEIQLLNHSIGRQVSDLGKAYAESSAQFTQLATQIRPEMDDYFRRANSSVEQYFSAFDATSSRIYSRLDRAVDLLNTMIEEVQQEKEQLADKAETLA